MGSSCTRQQGAVALLFSILLIVILGFIGLAFDLGRLYNRKVELQLVADTAALAAARSLNGTAAGIDAALASAAAAATRNLFRYDTVLVEWRNDAIEFSAAPAKR